MNADHIAILKDMLADYGVGGFSLEREALNAAISSLSVAQGQGFVPDKETIKFAMTAARLLQGFMLDTNIVGAREAGVNLAHGIKDYLAAAPAQPDGVE